jgi:peroxiredoxin
MRKFTVVLTVLFAGLALIAVPAFAADETPAPTMVEVGSVLPDDVVVTDLAGSKIVLNKAGEKPFTVYQFMTTACSACFSELNMLLKLQRQVGKDKIDIVPISVDMAGASAVNAYEGKNKFGLTYLLDSEFTPPPRFKFPYTPSFFVANSDGKVIYKKGGYSKSAWKTTAAEIKALVE